MKDDIKNTIKKIEAAHDSWTSLFNQLSSSGIQIDRSYSILAGSSLDELNSRVNATIILADSLKDLDENAYILVSPRLYSIDGSSSQIKTQSEGTVNHFRSYPDATFSDPSGNLNIQVMRGGSVLTTLNLASNLESISGQQMALLDQLTLALRFRRYKGLGIFLEKAREMQEMSGDLSEMLSRGASTLDDINNLLNSANEILEECSSAKVSIITAKDSISDINEDTRKASNEIEAKLSHIREISQSSNALSTQVDEYKASFEAFQKSLDERVSAHEKLVSNTVDAVTKNKERESEIDLLISKADTMIKGATTAGLSMSLDETRQSYEKRLKTTGRWFLFSVSALFICLLPIVCQLIPGPWQEWFKSPPGSNTDPWLATFGKFIFLLPATWAASFFANNYAELFHLQREYAHKAAMAKSVDGFKREAPEYKEEIVVGVFMEIRDNPGSRKAPVAATPESPIMTGILSKILDAIKVKG